MPFPGAVLFGAVYKLFSSISLTTLFPSYPSPSPSQPQLCSRVHYTFYHQPAPIKKENQTGWDSQGQARAPVSAAALWTGGAQVQVSAEVEIAKEEVSRSWEGKDLELSLPCC